MTAAELVERLVGHRTIGAAPREELAWLAARGSLRRLEKGDVLTAKGQAVAGLFLVLSGRIAIFIDRGTGLHKMVEFRPGDVTGMLPYSRLVSPPADSVAQEPSEILAVPREDFPAMIRECHEVTTILVHSMVDRARLFTSSGLQDEKMISLGKLSAGLAHELNNPASAIERCASLLDDRLDDAEQATLALGAAKLSDAQLAAIAAVRAEILAAKPSGVLSPLQQAERDDAISDWLDDRGLDEAIAGPLGETGLPVDALDRIAATVSGPALGPVLRWIASGCAVRGLASEILEASARISGLVTAIKGFTHMDQAMAAEPVDLASSLGTTVKVLNAKAREKSMAVTIDVAPDLPRVLGFVSELNQIWANLIDNALDAAPQGGRVDISAARDQDRVIVRVIDNGPGIPAAVRDRLFEPFFTTKPVGKGTGLGLDIVRRLVRHNDAEIAFESAPGRTEFRVFLPLAEEPTGATHS